MYETSFKVSQMSIRGWGKNFSEMSGWPVFEEETKLGSLQFVFVFLWFSKTFSPFTTCCNEISQFRLELAKSPFNIHTFIFKMNSRISVNKVRYYFQAETLRRLVQDNLSPVTRFWRTCLSDFHLNSYFPCILSFEKWK